MSTFSSVVRKPGQTIKPKSAPRRNVQRHAHKVTAPAATLTPESTPQSPHSHPTIQSQPIPTDPSVHGATSRVEPDVIPTFTPPPEVRDAVDPPTLNAVPASSDVVPVSAPPAEGGVVRRHNITSQVSSAETRSHNVLKRRTGPAEAIATPEETQSERDGSRTPAVRTPASSVPPSKRRKVAPQRAPSYIFSHLPEAGSRAQTATPQASSSSETVEDRPRASTEDLLQQATAQFGSVSKIADSIENRTRLLRPRTARASYAEVVEGNDSREDQSNQRSRASAIEELASAVVDQATGGGRRGKRATTSAEEAENHEINVNEVCMADLTKDRGLGKRSETGKELERNWGDIRERWKEGPEENRKKAREKTQAEKQARKDRTKIEAAQQVQEAQLDTLPPQQAILVNGRIVADVERQQISFSKGVAERAEREQSQAREYRKVDKYVNSARVGKWAGLRLTSKWDEENTELFYRGLRMFGTDFEMIASLFPTKTRPEIKSKYTRELKAEPDKVEANLLNKENFNLAEYTEMVGHSGDWEDPEEFMANLEAQREKAKADQEKFFQQTRLADDADIPIPSTEVDEHGNEIVRESTEVPVVDEHTRNIQDLADRVVAEAVLPAAQKKQRQRRTRESVSKVTGSKGKKAKQTLAGVEEVVGNLRDLEQ